MAYLSNDNILVSIGLNTDEVIDNIEKEISGIRPEHSFTKYSRAPLSLINSDRIHDLLNKYFRGHILTRFESIALLSAYMALKDSSVDPVSPRSLFILSTTKGNIEILQKDKYPPQNILLHKTACKIAAILGFTNSPLVICNACVSGVMALITAQRLIDSGRYDHIVVTGADVVTEFVVAGFESFKSMSSVPCRPFDVGRDGLSLGEGAGTLIITKKSNGKDICLVRGSTANDANHISGPSRTGEGLYIAASATWDKIQDIDFISAHGTATPYNDDMESIAIERLGLQHVPVNSFKGYFGHTLGAAGVIETILTKQSMLKNRVYKTLGLTKSGVASEISAVTRHADTLLKRCLKLSSGFGGSNATLILEKQ